MVRMPVPLNWKLGITITDRTGLFWGWRVALWLQMFEFGYWNGSKFGLCAVAHVPKRKLHRVVCFPMLNWIKRMQAFSKPVVMAAWSPLMRVFCEVTFILLRITVRTTQQQKAHKQFLSPTTWFTVLWGIQLLENVMFNVSEWLVILLMKVIWKDQPPFLCCFFYMRIVSSYAVVHFSDCACLNKNEHSAAPGLGVFTQLVYACTM